MSLHIIFLILGDFGANVKKISGDKCFPAPKGLATGEWKYAEDGMTAYLLRD